MITGSSASLPTGKTAASSDRHDAAAAPDGELLQGTAVRGSTSNSSSQDPQDTLETQSKPPFDSDFAPSSPSSTHSSIVHLSSPAGSEYSDFELIDSSKEVSQADGAAEDTFASQANDRPFRTSNRGEKANRKAKKQAPAAYRGHHTALPGSNSMDAGSSNDYGDSDWHQAGDAATQQDLAGPGAQGFLECKVDKPQKEGEGTQNAYISYLVTTSTDFKSFQSSHSSVRRRYTDFVFLYKTLSKEYPQCAVPPLPDKHNVSHVRGQGFAQDFISRRAHSLNRFLKRLTLHPVLRRAAVLTLFLESSDWNATMKSRPMRGMSGSENASTSVLETWTDTFLNAFTKPHKTDKRFADVNDRASKLDNDLGTVSKTVARVAKREADLEADYAELSTQFQKLASLEPGVQDELTKFSTSVSSTSEGWKALQQHTDQDYLGSLKDMEAYITAVKALLKTREQKQLDFEGLTEYLNKAAYERDTLASGGAGGFIRQKIEDVRGVDHEQSRRERQRKLEVQISRLQTEVEGAKKTSEAFDEEVVKEMQDFERIKAVEFRDTLGGLADANIEFFRGNIEIWERFIRDMERQQAEADAAEAR